MHGRIQEVPDLEPEPGDDPSAAESHGGILRRALELIRADFEESSWKAFWQTAVEGRNTADVARELGMSVFAVYQAKYRVQRKLRDELGEVLD
jgi:RNA polymerase sigma-70 factor (ECF subfamily)